MSHFTVGLLAGILVSSYFYKKAEFKITEVTRVYEETLKDYYYYGCMDAIKNSIECKNKKKVLK